MASVVSRKGAEDCAGPDLAGRLGAPTNEHGAEDGDDRDRRLRQRGPDGGEHASHCPEVQTLAEDLDSVREQRRGGENRRKGEDQLEYR